MTFIKNLEEIKTLCRICLNTSYNMISLENNLDDKSIESPVIIDVLENILMVKMDSGTDYPMEICQICRGNLKILCDLKNMFNKSQNILKKYISSLQELRMIDSKYNELVDDYGSSSDNEHLSDANKIENDESNPIAPKKIIKVQINKKTQNATSVKWVEGNKFIMEKKEKTVPTTPKCKQCNRIFESEEKLYSHQDDCKKDVPCKYCNSTFYSERSLRSHLRSQHGTNPPPVEIKCNICNKTFKNHNARSYHNITRHNTEGKKYTCEICGKAFYFRNSLNQHLESHSRDVSRVVCPICGKSFHYRGGLFYHMKIHRNERNYVCSFCNGKFLNMASLKRHTRIHTGERPYTCSFCPKTFCSISEVRTHERRHTGQKPHKCKYCGKRFITPYNLKLHTSSHVGSHPCDVCGKSYLNGEVLKYHLEMKHNIKESTIEEMI